GDGPGAPSPPRSRPRWRWCSGDAACMGAMIVDARAINDSGAIAATVCDSNANSHPPSAFDGSTHQPSARACQAVRLDPIRHGANGMTNWPSCSPF
ncbi:MAG TPA: hypothetical protein VI319_02515, partial [Burkholderiales bacterium]